MNSPAPNHIPVRYMCASKHIPHGAIYPLGMGSYNGCMDIYEIRLANMRRIAANLGGVAKLAKKLEMSYPLLQNYIGKTPTKRLGDTPVRRTEEAFDLPRGTLDTLYEPGQQDDAEPTPVWPFAVERRRFDALPLVEKERIGRFLKDTVETWEATQEQS